MQDLHYLAIIWCGVLVSAILARWTRLTSVLYFLAFGSLMVNIGWLPATETPFIQGFSQLGIILIMFALGFEENPGKFTKTIKRSWGIALFGAIAPFLIAYSVAMHFWGDQKLAMMCGLAMTATAVSLTMVSLRSEGLHTTDAARGIMTSAVIDSVSTIILVAILIPLATGTAEISIMQVTSSVASAMIFFGIVSVLGLWVFPSESAGRIMHRLPIFKDYGIRDVLMINDSGQTTLIILLMALTIGLAAHYLNLHPAVGAYMAGLILKKEYFHVDEALQTKTYEQTKHVIDNVAFTWIGPVFFVTLGTKIVLEYDIVISVLPQTLVMLSGLLVGQTLSAMLAARYTGRFEWDESILIGIGMLGRAELAFVVLDIGYVQHSIITTEAFYTLMFTAFWLNVSVPLLIRLWRSRFLKQVNTP